MSASKAQQPTDQAAEAPNAAAAELAKARELLRAERQRFQDVLDELPAYLVLLTPDYHVPVANRFFEERFGKSEGRRCFEYLFNRTEPCEICETFTVLKTHAPHHWEWTGPDGHNYDIYDFPFTDTDGSPLIMEVGLDITEIKRTQTALKELNESLERRVADRTVELRASEERARWLARFPEENPNPVLRVSADGTVLYRNPAAGNHPAWRCEVGQPLPQHALLRLVGQAMDSGRAVEQDVDMGGALFAVAVAPGRAERYANLYARDVTERRRAEEERRRHQEWLRVTLASIGDAVLASDPDGRITFLNPTAAKLTGWAEEEALGRSAREVFRIIDERTGQPAEDIVARVLWEGDVVTLANHTALVARDGRRVPVEDTAAPIRDSEGKVAGAVVVFHDVTEKRRAQESLRQSREDLDRAQAVGQIGSWRLDVRRNVLTWSDENHRIFGIPKGTPMTYETFLAAVHPDDRQHVDARWNAGLRGEPYDVEHRIVVDGQVKWVREKAYLEFDDAGKLFGGFGISQDITERKRAEQELRAAKEDLETRVRQRTADLSRTVDTLEEEVALRISAEEALRLRSEQLRALASELTLAEQRERRRLAEVLHDNLQQMLVGAKLRLTLLDRSTEPAVRQTVDYVQDLLDESIECSRSLTGELSPPILHHGGLVPALEWLAVWMQQKHALTVELQTDEDAAPQSEDMKVLLFQSARELLFNTVKHAHVDRARIHLARRDDHVELTVCDEGVGFDPAAAAAQTGKPGGFGLFSIRERLDLLGGRLEIDSAPGRGSRFRMLAPLAGATRRADPGPATLAGVRISRVAAGAEAGGQDDQARRRIRVLLVDDHVVVRQGLSRLLREESDMEVVAEASDGQTAVDLVRRLVPDVVMMDISMPGMDGVEATRIIHAELPQVRVIGLSMFEEGEPAARMRQAGAVDYLTKSGPADALLAAIRACSAAR